MLSTGIRRAARFTAEVTDAQDSYASELLAMSYIKLLTFSTLYPNQAQPIHGVFVEQRLRHLLVQKDLETQVVAPVPWFPAKHSLFGRYAKFASVPQEERRHGVRILHPRYPVIPKLGMTIAPFLMAGATYSTLRTLLADGYDFDIMDAHYFYPDGVAAAMLSRYFHKPVVITARGSDVNIIANHYAPRKMIVWAARQASGIVAVSEALKEKLIAIGVSADHIIVLRNGVDLGLFHPVDRAFWRKRLGLHGTTLLSIGHLVKPKGHDIVIQALAQLPGVRLRIAGEGRERKRLQKLAKTVGVSERVSFIGVLSQEELSIQYGSADALILASGSEGWPNVLLESMACGTPVIATRVGGTPEIVSTPEAGLLMHERTPQALVDAVQALRARYPSRDATRRYAERFDWQQTTQGQLALFQRILQRARQYH
jgi:teichuronic acid biosynthesis glycosyltransferase TuaC